jgi:aminomethyltransferase
MAKRYSALENEHRKLGAKLDDWNDMDVAWSYASSTEDQHDAVRDAAGLFDVTALKKVWITGSGALAAIQRIATRDMSKIYQGKSAYNPVLTEKGTTSDDNIIFHISENKYLYVHGTGNSYERLQIAAKGLDVSVERDDFLHDISFQGPKSVSILNPHCDADLDAIEYFHQVYTKLFGKDVLISRTGYSGERGFEIFVGQEDVVELWNAILDAGANEGVMACSFDCLDKVRVEAALLFYPYDMHEATTPWELGLNWSISRKKGEFMGSKGLFAAEGKQKVRFAGVSAKTTDLLDDEGKLMLNGEEVGTVNSPVYSHRMGKSLGLCHLRPDIKVGTVLQNVGANGSIDVLVEDVPFHDPNKSRTHV